MSNPYPERRLRARQWLAREPPAEQVLELYLELLDLQEPIYNQASKSGWDGHVPALLPEFQRFLRGVAPVATEVLAEIARSLEAAGDAMQEKLLETFLRRGSLEGIAGELGCAEIQLEFFPRAFLQPIAEAGREEGTWRGVRDAEPGFQVSCPRCGWPPQVGVLRDEPDVKGRRLLVCSLCGGEWPVRRSTCAGCGETDPEKLVYQVSESMPHIRVDECRTCRGYLKTVDLRKDGRAVPVVEDLASVELDLWCDERGFGKIQRNLMGF